jgi:hypothetical protein
MKKWIGPCISVLLVAALIYVSGPFQGSRETVPEYAGVKKIPVIFGQVDEQGEKKNEDSAYIALLKKLQEVLDGWLKSLNERIESEDITRLEVRFLEMLRSILEWVKGKIDAKVGPSPQKTAGLIAYFEMRPRPLPQSGEG